jgi:hypothetical protein
VYGWSLHFPLLGNVRFCVAETKILRSPFGPTRDGAMVGLRILVLRNKRRWVRHWRQCSVNYSRPEVAVISFLEPQFTFASSQLQYVSVSLDRKPLTTSRNEFSSTRIQPGRFSREQLLFRSLTWCRQRNCKQCNMSDISVSFLMLAVYGKVTTAKFDWAYF